MHATILDIDGTLIDSAHVDNRLYMSAVGSVLGRVRLREDWSTYTHVTDSGLLQEIARDNGIACSDETRAAVQAVFFDKLARHLDHHGPFPEIPGARAFVNHLRADPRTPLAYATGGWRHSARLKLARAGFPLDDIPLVTSDDFPDRESIMAAALAAIPGTFEHITYYGDGLWDQAAAARLGWRFVAVGARLDGIRAFSGMAPEP